MNSSVYIFYEILFLFILIVSSQDSSNNENIKRRKQDFYCSACKSMSETIFRDMNDVDPNERVQVGSYRVDGHGHQKLKEVPIIETRFHVENVLENLCSKFVKDAQESIPHQLKNIYEHACDDILEEHHDSLIDTLVKKDQNTESSRLFAEYFCVQINQYCKTDELEELYKPVTTTPQVQENEENTDKKEL